MMLQFASKLIMYWNFNWIWRHLILTIYWQYIFLLHKNKNSGRNRKVDYDVVFCCPYKHSKVTNLNYFKNEKYDILPINIGKYICVFCDTCKKLYVLIKKIMFYIMCCLSRLLIGPNSWLTSVSITCLCQCIFLSHF